jgi:hypothetical protein
MPMPRPDNDVLIETSRVAKSSVKLVEFLKDWEERELRDLPMRKENVAVGQGRCQVLGELVKFFEESVPRSEAKS